MTASQRSNVKAEMRRILRNMTNGQLYNLTRDPNSPSGKMARRMLAARMAKPH